MLSSFAEQAHQALRNLGVLLQEAGGGYQDVLFVQLYLLDIGTIEQFNGIFKEYFPVDPPARAVCQPVKLYPGALVMLPSIAFLLAALVLAVTPGPGIAYVVARTAAGGRAEGLASCVGTGLGGLLHVCALDDFRTTLVLIVS